MSAAVRVAQMVAAAIVATYPQELLDARTEGDSVVITAADSGTWVLPVVAR